jgi:ABC-type transport system involved in Fe-S cluster assembly fused permease/ATPase subunit
LILFEIIPIFLDIIIALAVFVAYFEWSLALIIAIIITAYGMSIRTTVQGKIDSTDFNQFPRVSLSPNCERFIEGA